jgi:hypothetical protein
MEESRMTSSPADPPAEGGNVVPLRAVDAGTEVRADESAGPSYVDLTSGDAQRRPLIPEHWRTRENARRHVALAAARHGHRAAYHGLRSPSYFVKALGFAVWGVVVTITRLISWWHIPGTTRLEWQAAADGLIHEHLRLNKQGREVRKARGTILALCLAGLAAAAVALARFGPWWSWLLVAVALFVAFALAGRPQGKTITTRAEIPAQVQPPTQDVIIRALGSLGIAEINRAIKELAFPPRFCLKVMDQIANDMVLGTSAYKQGIRATTFRAGIDAGLGYQIGAADHPLVVRTFYLNLPDTERAAKRARALREAAGTLSGVALGQDDATPERDVLADAAEVLAGASGMHWQPLADRLAERFPERWAGATGDAVRAELGARGVRSVVVTMDGQRARGCRAADVDKAAGQ